MAWKKIETPKRKDDWRYKFVRLLVVPPSSAFDWANNRVHPPLPVREGDVARIYMRRSYLQMQSTIGIGREQEFGKRVLELRWQCPTCRHGHALFIPETWVEEGKAEFVEQEDARQI